MRVHAAQECIVESVIGRIADHRVDAAARAQRSLFRVDPHLDLRIRKAPKAEETRTTRARLDLCAVAGRVFVCGNAELGVDHTPSYHAPPSKPRLIERARVSSVYRSELARLEGVWQGTELVRDAEAPYEATARLSFQTLFDGRFLLCDYVQTAPDKPMSVAHGVFRKDALTNALTVTWFRSAAATASQQANAVADGDKLIFLETVEGRTTRTTYSIALDRLSIQTEVSTSADEWTPILNGSYRRR